jgi:ankyrin repeat protein
MILKKFYNFLILGSIVVLAMSCASTKKTSVTKKASEPSIVEKTNDIKETAPIEKPSKVRPQIDPTLAANNLDEINKYIDDLNRWTYVERVIAPYETIDEAINQDSIKILHRVIASYNSIKNQSEADAGRLNYDIDFLLQKKADVNLLNDDGEDALTAFLKIGSNSSRTLDAYNRAQKHHSAEELEPMVKLFIENGADIKLKDKSGVSTFERIVDFAGMDFIKPLLDSGIEIDNALSAAVKHNHFELINYLLDKGAILNTATEEGKDAFMHVAKDIDDLELFKRIVDKTSDINVEIVAKNQQRRNALSYMIYIGQDKKYKDQLYFSKKLVYLLDKGIKINEKDWDKPNEENSLIVQALKSFKYEDADIICKKLIENGANVNLTYFKKTPLYYLLKSKIYYDSESLLLLLIEKGADVNFVNQEKTPLDLMIALVDSKKEDIRNRALKYSEILKSNGAKTFDELEQ